MSKNSRVIVGLGKTGLSYARYLTERNLDYKVLDDNPNNAYMSELNKIKPEVEIRRINSLVNGVKSIIAAVCIATS